MLESSMVRSAIVLYLVFVSIALLLLWKNAAAPDALKNTGILVASILPVLIAILPYINLQIESFKYRFILLYDSKDKTLTTGDSWNPYESTYMHLFTNLSKRPSALKADNISDFQENKGLDLIEKGIVATLMIRFMSHWDVVWREDRGPNYVVSSGGRGAIEASKQIPLEQIRQDFSHNSLISAPDIMVGSGFHIPPASNLSTSQPDKSRIIKITTPYSAVSITIQFSYSMVAQHGIWGILKPDPQNLNRYYTIEYHVSLAIRPKRFKKYAPEMESYSRWHENIRNSLQSFDWEYVDKQIEQRVMREAILKTIDKESILNTGDK